VPKPEFDLAIHDFSNGNLIETVKAMVVPAVNSRVRFGKFDRRVIQVVHDLTWGKPHTVTIFTDPWKR
jgi:hypothetical protein